MKKLIFIILIVLSPSFVFGAALEKYFATGGSGSTCSEISPCAFTYIDDVISAYDDATDTLTIYLNKGDTWTFTSNSNVLYIDKSNVTIDAYGTGAKPIINGDNLYPSGCTNQAVSDAPAGNIHCISYNYFIRIGEYATTSNVSIKNIRFINAYQGGGIIFNGSGAGKYFTGPGLVEGCEFNNIGWAPIAIYRVPNSGGEATAITIQNNDIENTGVWPKDSSWSWGWSQAIQSNDGYSLGHIARYNLIRNVFAEGIGAEGFDLIEYNVIGDARSAGIYLSPTNRDAPNTTTVVRYNLLWLDSDGNYNTAKIPGIRVEDEGASGDNTNWDMEIYGNIIIGLFEGISFKNTEETSSFGDVKLYGNTIIDCQRSFVFANSAYFGVMHVANNASIIYTEASAVHVAKWGTYNIDGWTIGHNFFDNGIAPATPLSANAVGPSGVDSILGKTSGWRSLTTAPSLNDFTPQTGSDMIDNESTDDLGVSYDDYIYTGEWTDLPATESLTTTTQGANGEWEFGAIIIASAIPNQSNNGPTGEIPCGDNPQSYNQSVTTDIAADCKWDTADTTYALMTYTYDTVNYTQHTDPQSEACGSASITHYTRCRNHYDTDQIELSSTTNTFNIGDPPAPQSSGGGDIVTLGSGIIGIDVSGSGMDYGVIDLM